VLRGRIDELIGNLIQEIGELHSTISIMQDEQAKICALNFDYENRLSRALAENSSQRELLSSLRDETVQKIEELKIIHTTEISYLENKLLGLIKELNFCKKKLN